MHKESLWRLDSKKKSRYIESSINQITSNYSSNFSIV